MDFLRIFSKINLSFKIYLIKISFQTGLFGMLICQNDVAWCDCIVTCDGTNGCHKGASYGLQMAPVWHCLRGEL